MVAKRLSNQPLDTISLYRTSNRSLARNDTKSGVRFAIANKKNLIGFVC